MQIKDEKIEKRVSIVRNYMTSTIKTCLLLTYHNTALPVDSAFTEFIFSYTEAGHPQSLTGKTEVFRSEIEAQMVDSTFNGPNLK